MAACLLITDAQGLEEHDQSEASIAARASRLKSWFKSRTWQEFVVIRPVQGAVLDGVVRHPQEGALGHSQLACQADVAAPHAQLPDAHRWVPAQQVRTGMLAEELLMQVLWSHKAQAAAGQQAASLSAQQAAASAA